MPNPRESTSVCSRGAWNLYFKSVQTNRSRFPGVFLEVNQSLFTHQSVLLNIDVQAYGTFVPQ